MGYGFLLGQNDTFYAMLVGGKFGGLSGPNITDLEMWYEHTNGQRRQFLAQSTGVTSTSTLNEPDYDVDNIGRHYHWKLTATFYTRDELTNGVAWRSCVSADVYAKQGCNVWLSTQAIRG